MAGPLVNRSTGVTSKPFYAGQAATANMPTYSDNDPRLQVRQNPLLATMNARDPTLATAIMGIGASNNGAALWQAIGQRMQALGFSDNDIRNAPQVLQGNMGNMAQKYGNMDPGQAFSQELSGSPFASFFGAGGPQAPKLPPATPNAPGSQPTAAAGAGTNPITGAPNPTNGVWNVNTLYGPQGTGSNNVASNSNGQVWNPGSAFHPGTTAAPPTPTASTGGLLHQLNTPPAPATNYSPTDTRTTNNIAAAPAPTPANNNSSGYSFVAPGWNGSGIQWRSGSTQRQF